MKILFKLSLCLVMYLNIPFFSQSKPIISNYRCRNLSKNEKELIFREARKCGITDIKEIFVGTRSWPIGYDTFYTEVVERESIKKKHIISFRTLWLKNIYFIDSTSESDSMQFAVASVDAYHKWRIGLGRDTIDIDINRTANYEEIYKLVKMLKEKKFSFPNKEYQVDAVDIDVTRITEIKKFRGKYRLHISYGGGGWITVICEYRKRRLLLKVTEVIMV